MNFDCPASCPFVATQALELSFPVGQLRRLGGDGLRAGTPGPADDSPEPSPEVDETKRNVLKLLGIVGVVAAAAGGLTGGALQFVQQPTVGVKAYPKVQLLDLDGSPLTVTKVESEYNVYTSDVLTFFYPLTNEPNFFLNVAPVPGRAGGATNVPGGIGHQKSIVAYSAICQHLGCPAPALAYYPPGTCPSTPGGRSFYIHCSCHGSTYDVANSAANLTGPAVFPLPQVTLEWDTATDLIFAVGESGPAVNGHLDTLAGGYPVPGTVPLQKQSPIIDCAFPSV